MTSGTNHYTNTHLKKPKFLPVKFIVKRRETVSKLRLIISEFQANGKHVCVCLLFLNSLALTSPCVVVTVVKMQNNGLLESRGDVEGGITG